MRQALLIFRKDAGHLWPQSLPLLLFTGILGWMEARFFNTGPLVALLRGLWLLSALFLMAAAVHQEHLPGHQQYWLTRPYSWRSLLLAKLLFLGVFVVLPEFAIEAVSLAMNGVSPLRYIPRLTSTTLIFAGAGGLIFVALAAVTENLVQLMWAILPAFGLPVMSGILLAIGDDPGRYWFDIEWVRLTVIGLAALASAIAVLYLQYRRRETVFSRCILGGAILLFAASPFLGSWHAARRIQSTLLERPPDPSVARIAFDTGSRRVLSPTEPDSLSHLLVPISLPILVTGIPDGGQVMVERTSVRIETPDGKNWSSGWPQHAYAYAATATQISHGMPANGPYWQSLSVDEAIYRTVKDIPVHLHTTTALVLFTHRKTIELALNGDTGPLDDGGICNVSPAPFDHLFVGCAWPSGSPPLVYAKTLFPPSGPTFVSLLSLGSGNPFSLDGSVWDGRAALISAPRGKMQVQVEIWQSAVHFDRELDIPQIRLADYHRPGITDLR